MRNCHKSAALILAGLLLASPARAGWLRDGIDSLASLAPSSTTCAPATPIEVGFSTDKSSLALVLSVIDGAKKELRVAAFAFSSNAVADALIRAHRRGVVIGVVVDARQAAERYSFVPQLARAGIAVRIDSQHFEQHNKFIVVDGATVETGSFNYTAAATQRNAENVLVIHDNPTLAKAYITEWQTHWKHSRPLY